MANIKPVILVNHTDGELVFTPAKVETEYRNLVVPNKETGEPETALREYEVLKPDTAREVKVAPSLDRFDRSAKPGYAVLKKSTWEALTDARTGISNFEQTWANPRGGLVEVLDGPKAADFVAAWDVDVVAEAQ